MPHRASLLLALLALVPLGSDAAAQGIVRPPPSNREPIVTSDLPENAVFASLAPIRIQITVTDPEGDRVNARWVDRSRRVDFEPIVDAPSGTTRELEIYPSYGFDYWAKYSDAGRNVIKIESWDSRRPDRRKWTEFEFTIIGGVGSRPIQRLDMHGDEALELVVRAETTTVNGVLSAGGYVAVGPPAELGGAGIGAHELLHARAPRSSGFDESEEQSGDVDGDGKADLLVVHNRRDVLVWLSGRGGATGRPADGLLRPTDLNNGTSRPALFLADVTHDGVLDVVLGCPWTDTSVVDAGEVLVFAGGPGIVGTPAPTATLRLSAPVAADQLGFSGYSWDPHTVPFCVGDVDGDGAADLLVLSPLVDDATAADVGAIHVWKGGAAMTGSPAPSAILATTGPAKSRMLGRMDGGRSTFLVDVTGDGIRDVVVGSRLTDPEGAIFVWDVSGGLTGVVDPTARLEPAPGATFLGQNYSLMHTDGGIVQPLQFADVDLDGITDVLGLRVKTKVNGLGEAGAVYFFKGGPTLVGTVNETALLHRATPGRGDRIGIATNGFQLVDVTGDGALDVVAASHLTNRTALAVGSVEVWPARSGLSGMVPSASLEVASPTDYDWLCYSTDLEPVTKLQFHDVTGDGIRDVIAVASVATIGGQKNRGAAYVWAGGPSLTSPGSAFELATLQEAANVSRSERFGVRIDRLGGADVKFLDWTGDGIDDLLFHVRSRSKFGPPYSYSAHLLVFAGGPTLSGLAPIFATLTSTETYDECAKTYWVAEVTGDGILDVIAAARYHDTPLGKNLGALLVFAGGPNASGVRTQTTTLIDEQFGGAANFGEIGALFECDLDGDRELELVSSWSHAGAVERVQVIRRPVPPGLVPLVPIFAPLEGNSNFGE